MSALITLILEILVSAIKQEKETNDTLVGREEMKLSLFRDYMIVYVKNPRKSILKTPRFNK